jgi:membrane-bound lytic murein transglycosylase A
MGGAVRAASWMAAHSSMVAILSGIILNGDELRAQSASKQATATVSNSAAVSFKPVAFADLPGWDLDDHAAAFDAFVKSCMRLLTLVRSGTLAGRMAPPAPEYLNICDEAARLRPRDRHQLAKAFFERNFVAHTLVHKRKEGLLTGYYEPLLEGSRTPTGPFQTPIYRRPPDLVNLVDETHRGAKNGVLTHARRTDKGIEPFPTRADIERGALQGQGLELIYLTDPVAVFFLQIQGSGRIKLNDGSMIRIGYDGKNGHPYSSIGQYLIDEGIFAADKMSLDALASWLRANPERAKVIMQRNASYVFFRELKGSEASGPLGAVEIPLTPGRSLAVDANYHAIGLPIYVSAPTLTHVAKTGGFNRLMIAQDVGSAIRGPERGDIYFGSGDAAGRLAGITKHPGKFYVLLAQPGSVTGEAAPASSPKRVDP